MANAAASIAPNRNLVDLVRHTFPIQEQAVEIYRRLLALNELSSSLNSAMDMEDIFRSLTAHCMQYMPGESASIYLVEDSSCRKVRLSGAGSPKEEGRTPLNSGVAGTVIKTATPLWAPNTLLSRKLRKTSRPPLEALARSVLALPIKAIGKTIGCLEMTSGEPDRFNELEYHLGLLVATHLSSALENVLRREELAAANSKLRDHDRRLTQLNTRLQELAHTDEATGLHNKRRLFEQLEMETARAKRYGEILSCMMIDIDDFKKINDTLGHQAGDELLRQTGLLLKKSLRVTDFIARYGGEEFTVILPRTNSAGAHCAAENLRSRFMDHPFRIAGGRVHITISIGIASCTTFDSLDARSILMRADSALYRSKRNGKNQTSLFEETNYESENCQVRQAALTR